MKVVLDIILAAIVALSVFLGIRKGFVSTVAKPVRIISALSLSVAWAKGFGDSVIKPMIFSSFSKQLGDYLRQHYQDLTPENALEKMPSLFKLAASLIGGFSTEGVSQDQIVDYIVEKLASPVIGLFATIFAFIFLYITLSIVISLVLVLIDELFKTGPFSILNRAIGALFGVLLGVSVAWAFSAIFGFILPLFGEANWITKFGQGGAIYRFFRSHSILDLLLAF